MLQKCSSLLHHSVSCFSIFLSRLLLSFPLCISFQADVEVPKVFLSRCFCMQILCSELCPHFTLDAEVIFSAFFTFPELYFPHEIHLYGWDVVDHSAWEQSDARIKQDEKATKCNLKCSLCETGNGVWITEGTCLLHHCVVIPK